MKFPRRNVKPWMALVFGVGLLSALVSLGAIIQVGQGLDSLHPTLAWLFYGVLLIFSFLFVVRPLTQTFSSGLKDLEPIRTADAEGASKEKAIELGRWALKNWNLEPDLRKRLEYEITFEKDPSKVLREAVQSLEEKMDQAIGHRARAAFAGVAISQHGPLDALFLLSCNVMLVRDLVVAMGARPAITELAKLYCWTFVGAFAVYQIEESDLLSWFPALGGALGRSMTQGAGAAFLTLRVGHLAKGYLIRGGGAEMKPAREMARGAARRALPKVIVSGATRLPASLARRIEEAFARKKSEVS